MANRKALQLNDKMIQGLKKPDSKKWVRDGGGLALCLTTAKKGPWRFWYFIYVSPETGKKCYKPLGGYPDIGLSVARDLASDLVRNVSSMVDPKAEDRRVMEAKLQTEEHQRKKDAAEDNAMTISKLITEYIEKHAKPSKRSWKEDERILSKDALSSWGDRKAGDIKKRDVVLLLEKIVERGSPGSANNNFKILRKMFRFAVQRDILEHSPCDGVVMPAPLVTKDRALTEPEIKALWFSMDSCSISYEIKRAIKLILVTAQRPGEVIGMHTSEIDGKWWTIPAERTKNKKAHRVYLTDTALELIGPLEAIDEISKKMKPKGYIFHCPLADKDQPKTKKGQPAIKKNKPMKRLSISQAIMRALAVPVKVNGQQVFNKAGEPVTENKLGVNDFTPHDLRRTANTLMAASKIIKEHRERVLNHTLEKLDGTYNLHDYDDEKQMALEALERKLNSIIAGKESGKVISIGSKKAA